MSSIRSVAKRVGPIYRLNAALKARGTRRDLRALRARYASETRRMGLRRDDDRVFAEVRERLAARQSGRAASSFLRVFWVGANREQDRTGLLPSLERIADVVTFRAPGVAYGPLYPRGASPDADVIERNSRALVEQVRAASDARVIDVVIGQMWRHLYDVAALRELQSLGCAMLNISWDDRLPEMWIARRGFRFGPVALGPGTDLVLTSSPETCAWYAVEGVAAVFLPMASDPHVYRPLGRVEHRASFVGSRYGVRERIVNAIRSAGIPLDVYGPGWPNGALAANDVAKVFGTSAIVLGIGTVAHTDDVVTMKLRDFDAPMSGALYLTHRNDDLRGLFDEGREIAFYADAADCVDKLRWYLEHEDARARIAEAGHRRAVRDHTWEQRFTDLFERLGFTVGRRR